MRSIFKASPSLSTLRQQDHTPSPRTAAHTLLISDFRRKGNTSQGFDTSKDMPPCWSLCVGYLVPVEDI